MKYIAVYHNWWMDSGFFESEIIEADSFDDAKMKADAYAHRNSHTFNHCRAVVLEIGPAEHVIRRRLTWGERLSGYISGKPASYGLHPIETAPKVTELLRGNWHGVSLDGRNEHGSHVLNLPQRSIELEQDEDRDFLKEDAETILSDAERLGFSIGDAVIATFALCKGDDYDSWYEYSGISLELTELFYGSAKEQRRPQTGGGE